MLQEEDYLYISIFHCHPKKRYQYLRQNITTIDIGQMLKDVIYPKIYNTDLVKFAVFLNSGSTDPYVFCDTREQAWSLNPYKVVDVPIKELENPKYSRYWTEYSTNMEKEEIQ